MAADSALTFCLTGFPGAHRALATLARTTGLTRHLSIASPDPAGVEIEFCCAHVREARPDLVIVGAWSPAYEPIVDAAKKAGARVAVYWTSSGGQSGLGREIGKLAAVLRHPKVDHFLSAGRDLAGAIAGAVHLPVTLDLRRVSMRQPPRRARARVSLFFPWREAARKNALNALLAASIVRERIELNLNGLTEDDDFRALLDALCIPHRELGWMSEGDYRRALARIDVGLQPSFAETFDYVAADHLARGRPVIGSAMVPVIADLPATVRKHLIVHNPDNAAEIAEKLERLLGDRQLRARVGEAAAAALRLNNERNIATASKLLALLSRRSPSRQAFK